MSHKKLHLLIFVFLPAILFVMQSCEKKPQEYPKKSNLPEINRLIAQGEKHFEKVEYDSSYYYFNKAKSLCDVKKDTGKIIYSLLNMATIEQTQGDLSGCEATLTDTFPLLINNKKPLRRWGVFMSIGYNYLIMFDYVNALHYFNKALNLKTDKYRKLDSKNNIALVHMEMHNYQKAIKILEPLTIQKNILNYSIGYSRIIDNLGTCYSKTRNPKALSYLSKGLEIRKKRYDELGLSSSYIDLSEHFKNSNPSLSLKYAKLAYAISTKAKIVDDRLQCLQLLIETSPENQLRKLALDYTRIKDSITKARQIAKNQFAKIKYDSKLDREENLMLKTQKAENSLELEQQKNKNLILSFLILIGFLITFLLYYFLKTINKREKIQTTYKTETRIGKKLHDELANDVYHTMAFAETQDLSSSQNKEILINNLDAIYSRTRNISKENSTIDTGLNFVSGLKEMMSDFNTDAVNVLVNGMDTVNWNALERNKKIIVYRVLQELLVNMKKHSQCSLAVITFKKNENKLQIDYSDNGLGAAFEKINSRNGLRNVENRIMAIKGTITFDTKSSKGFKTSFTFPI